MQTNSGQPCGICGDIGIVNHIATCSKCRKSREHIYCMNPNLYNVPRSWHCEACRRENLVHRDTGHFNGSKEYSGVEVQDSSKRQKTWISENASSKLPDASNRTNSPYSKSGPHFLSKKVVPKKVANGKVKYIPAEDVCGPSGAKSKLKSLHGASSSQMRSLGTNQNFLLRTSTATKSFPQKVRAHKSVSHLRPPAVSKVISSTLQKPAVELSQSLGGFKSQLPYACKSSPREDFRYMSGPSVGDKRHISEAHPSPFGQTMTMSSGVQEKPEFGKTSSGSKIDAGKVNALPEKNYVCQDNVKVPYKFGEEDLPNPPAIVASWKGCFEVVNAFREICDGFQAYLPEKVSRKAYVVSQQLPRVLKFELLPRRDVWPDIFHSKSPCAFDIALYFWVDEFCRARENYHRLMELMEKEDLSMRCHFDGAELLIFNSRQLPTESPAYTATENTVTVSQKANEGIEIVASEVDKWMTSNRNVTCRDNSQDEFSKIHSNQPVQNSTASRHVHKELKREQWSEFDAPPGYSQSDDAPPGYSRSDDAPPGYSLSDDAPPGFLRPLITNASDDSHIVPPQPKMSHVAKKVNTPGSSNWNKLREEVSSSKVIASKDSRATPSNGNNGRRVHPIVKTADLPVRPWKEGHDGRARVSTQPRENSTWDPIPSKKPHDGKDLLSQKGSERDRNWDHMIWPKEDYNDGWGTQSVAALQSNKNEGWGNPQSVGIQSHIPSNKLCAGNDLLGHDGRARVSTQPREKSTRDPIPSKKPHDGKDLLAEKGSELDRNWDHMIRPKEDYNDGWGTQSVAAFQSNKNEGWGNPRSVGIQSHIPSNKLCAGNNLLGHDGRARVSTQPREKSTRDPIPSKKPHDGKDLLAEKGSERDRSWDHLIRPKEDYNDGWGTPRSVAAIQSNKNEGWGNPQSVGIQSHIPSNKLCAGNDLLGHDGRARVSTQPREKSTRDPIPSKKPHDGKDLLAEKGSELDRNWDHMIRPKEDYNDGWGTQSVAAFQSNKNEGWGNPRSVGIQSHIPSNKLCAGNDLLGHDGRARVSTQPREKSTRDPIPSKKPHDGKDLLAEKGSERDRSWDHLIRPKEDYNDGWGTPRSVAAIQSNKNEGWGNPQSVTTQSHIPSKKLGAGNDLLGKQASGENSWDHLIPPKEEIHVGWGNKDSVPIQSRKEELLVKQEDGWGHMIPPETANHDAWSKRSNENNGARDSTRKESNVDNSGRSSRWDSTHPKKERYDGWGTNSVTPKQSNGRDLQWNPIHSEREPRHGRGSDFSTTQSREENARRDLPIRSKSEPRDGRGKDLASTQHARTDSPIRPNKYKERERDSWRRDRRRN